LPGSAAVIAEVMKLGLPGIAILALAYAFWMQKIATEKCWNDRITDWKSAVEVLEAVKAAMGLFSKTSEVRDNTQADWIRVVEIQAQALVEVRRELAEVKAELNRLREAR
jgi:hypothetical protein